MHMRAPALLVRNFQSLRLCDFACPGNAFLAQARLGSEHVPVLTNLAALPNHAIVSKPYTGGFLTQSCTWRPDVKLLRDTEAAGLRLDQPGHAMAPPCNARDTPFDKNSRRCSAMTGTP